MSQVEERLIKKATRIHKKIYPCAHKKDFADCFTKDDKRIMFWFNTEDESTHVVAEYIKPDIKK
jgi:hypothetical protein